MDENLTLGKSLGGEWDVGSGRWDEATQIRLVSTVPRAQAGCLEQVGGDLVCCALPQTWTNTRRSEQICTYKMCARGSFGLDFTVMTLVSIPSKLISTFSRASCGGSVTTLCCSTSRGFGFEVDDSSRLSDGCQDGCSAIYSTI